MQEDGALQFLDDDGNVASEALVDAAKRQKGEQVRAVIQKAVDDINASIEALGSIHLDTPPPNEKPKHIPVPFDVPPPEKPAKRGLSLLDRLVASRRQGIDDEYAAALVAYDRELAQWQQRKVAHEQDDAQRKMLVEHLIYRAAPAMEIYLEEVLQDIVWPRETSVTFEVSDDLQRVQLALDLPEIEDLPRKTASIPATGWKAVIKGMSDTQLRRLYMAHVHGVAFRIIGETFAALPTIQQVIVSAFSQRANAATGHVQDEYLYSVRVQRQQWAALNFANLASIDVVEALAGFDLRRSMSKTGVFKPVEPISL